MKNTIKAAAVIALSLFAAACAKETKIESPNEDQKLHFTVNTAENAVVKSFIESDLEGTYVPQWSNGDKLAIFVGAIGEKTKPTGVLSNVNEKGTLAKFDGIVTGIEGSGTFKSFTPASAFAISYNSGNVGITLAESQKPSSLTIDEACDILVAKDADYTADADSKVTVNDLFFKRMFSIVKVALKGPATLNGEKVQKFSLTAPEGTVLAGRAAINLSTATIEGWNVKNNAVTATYEADAPVFGGVAGLENVVWLVVNPCTVASGAKVVFAGETAGYTFSKEVTLAKDLVFPESKLAVINLTLAEENCTKKQTENRIYVEDFGKVTSNKTTPQPSATGAVGTGVSKELTYIYSGKNTNIRFNSNGHSSNNPFLYISSESDSFTIEKIVLNNETSLKLSAQARTASSTQTVSVSYKESSATVWTKASSTMSAGTDTFDTVQSVVFSIDPSVKSLDLKFEATGATLVDDIVLNSFEDTRVKLEAPINLSAILDETVSNKVNLAWDVVNNAKSYEVVLGAEGKADIVKIAESASLSVEGLEYSTLYSVKVKAISADVEKYIDSDYCAAVSVTTGVKPEGGALVEKTATIKFGKNNVEIIKDPVTANDDQKNSWTITTVGTTFCSQQSTYSQVGSSNNPATSITFTTTLPEDAEVTSISAKFGGFSGTAGTVTLKVGETSVGTGKLDAKNDVTVTSTSTAVGNKVTITVTNIAKGVKCYNIQVKYKTAN